MTLTPDTDKINELLNKLYELSIRGDDNERNVAEKKLNQIIKKYGITDFSENNMQRVFKIEDNNDCLMILSQCVWSVKGNIEINYKGKKAFVKLNASDYILISEKYKYYYSLYKEQKNNFFTAFIIKNELVAKSGEKNINNEKADKVNKIMNSIEKGVMPSKMIS